MVIFLQRDFLNIRTSFVFSQILVFNLNSPIAGLSTFEDFIVFVRYFGCVFRFLNELFASLDLQFSGVFVFLFIILFEPHLVSSLKEEIARVILVVLFFTDFVYLHFFYNRLVLGFL